MLNICYGINFTNLNHQRGGQINLLVLQVINKCFNRMYVNRLSVNLPKIVAYAAKFTIDSKSSSQM